jgi:hypothetical protein
MDEAGKDPVDTNFSRRIKLFALNTVLWIRTRIDFRRLDPEPDPGEQKESQK